MRVAKVMKGLECWNELLQHGEYECHLLVLGRDCRLPVLKRRSPIGHEYLAEVLSNLVPE